ncbi:MAG: hypothetical protein KKA79_08220 [Nanoarchaeota archaeon]|nr:hypothetical protein [Nanoarchaeota archaeon]MCG2718628.1 hypothetical protein [Nanoarchaeota archaeon]
MATILDSSLLDHFIPIFVFLFVFIVSYSVLLKTRILGNNKGLISVASFSVSLLFIVTQSAVDLIQLITPWFVVFIIVSMCILVVFMFLGVKPETIAEAVSSESTVWIIIIIMIVLFGLALTKVVGPSIAEITQGESGTDDSFMGKIGVLLFHPKIIGVLFILLVASYAIKGITR